MITLQGIPVSGGTVREKILVYTPFTAEIQTRSLAPEAVDEEIARFEAVFSAAQAELKSLAQSLPDADARAIMDAHLELLTDPAVHDGACQQIRQALVYADQAVEDVLEPLAQALEASGEAVFAERAADLRDIKRRLLRIYAGEQEMDLSRLDAPVILAAYDLLPSDTASMDTAHVRSIVTQVGGTTSHTAILARSYGIPAILGIPGLMDVVKNGMDACLDASSGVLTLQPDAQTIAMFEKKCAAAHRLRLAQEKFAHLPMQTADGVRIELGANIGSSSDAELAACGQADYIGLFRTEFLYMGCSHLPTEDEQLAAYRHVLQERPERPVTVRTLDIGGDKQLPYFHLPKEENPFLGCRAIRLCFANPELLKPQLRALLRASTAGTLWIMLPMVSALEQISAARTLIRETAEELEAEGIPVSKEIKLGVMIEIPSLALMADACAQAVDFASIGTNDLCQYLTAAARGNPAVSSCYQPYHPALFRLIGEVSRAFARAGKPLSVCGELGGDPLAAPVLVGLGLRKLSMSQAAACPVKMQLNAYPLSQLESIADRVCACPTASEVEALLHRYFDIREEQ